jgi:hypothetical protein
VLLGECYAACDYATCIVLCHLFRLALGAKGDVFGGQFTLSFGLLVPSMIFYVLFRWCIVALIMIWVHF